MSDLTFVDVEFTRYEVEVTYTCPFCGHVHTFKPTKDDIYSMLECSIVVHCDNCGKELDLTSDNC